MFSSDDDDDSAEYTFDKLNVTNNTADYINANNNDQSYFVYDDEDNMRINNNNSNKKPKKNSNIYMPSYIYTTIDINNNNINVNKKKSKKKMYIMSYEEQLEKAIFKGNKELCNEIIILKCLDLNKQINRKLPLGIACENNYYEIVELLIKNGAELNLADFFDQTALHYAINSADLDVIKYLINFGAEINKSDPNGLYPLHLAICRKNDEICDYLLSKGAWVNVKDKQGNTPLSLAISNEYVYMIYRLLDYGADVNIDDKNGDTPLIKSIWMIAALNDTNEILNIVKRLLNAGADVNAKNETGRTALFTAIYQNNTELSLYLIDNGAKCQMEDSIIGNFTLLHYACFQGNIILAKKLLENGCDVNAPADYNETPICIATTKGYVELIDLLITYGADVNVCFGDDLENQSTPLQAAIYYISDYELFKQIVEKLVKGNVNLSIDMPGPIIMLCLQYSKFDYAKYLISIGADVEQRTIFNQSCFYKAFTTKNIEFLKMCIMAGFDLYGDVWINDYLENPDFIECPDYLNDRISGNSSRTEQELSAFIDEEEYFNRRNNKTRTRTNSRNECLKKEIYELLKYHTSNPLTLKELSRIAIRKAFVKIDFNLKEKIEQRLPIPLRIKNYLLLKEFYI